MSDTTDRLAAYRACERQILTGGQSVRAPDGRSLSLPDLAEIRAQIDRLARQAARARAGRRVDVALADFSAADTGPAPRDVG